MAIAGRHIQKDWSPFPSKQRVKVYTLCGKRTSTKYTGFPGFTVQETEVMDNPGWCIACSRLFYSWKLKPSTDEAYAIYEKAFKDVWQSMKVTTKNVPSI